MPSGNAVAALALHRLGLLIGRQAYTESAERALQSVADNVNQTAFHAASFVALLEALNRPPFQIILRGEPESLAQWRAEVLPRLKPDQAAYFIPNDAQDLPDEIAQKTSDQAVSAWICEGFACRQPLHDLDGLIQSIDEQDQEPDHNH
jgi:uncharacterized protein YyaL (SSP411 family)